MPNSELTTLIDRLIYARERKEMSQQDVATAVGMKQPSYYQLESGKTKKSRYIYDIAKVLDVSADWLINGTGPMEEGSDDNYIVLGGSTNYKLIEIPYKDIRASCGNGYINEDSPAQKGVIALTHEFLRDNDLPLDGNGLVFMHACGDSMGYTIPNETLMLVNINENEFNNFISAKIYVFNADGETICKRAFKNLDGTVTLVSDNADKTRYPDQVIDKNTFNDFSMFGRVRYTFNKQ